MISPINKNFQTEEDASNVKADENRTDEVTNNATKVKAMSSKTTQTENANTEKKIIICHTLPGNVVNLCEEQNLGNALQRTAVKHLSNRMIVLELYPNLHLDAAFVKSISDPLSVEQTSTSEKQLKVDPSLVYLKCKPEELENWRGLNDDQALQRRIIFRNECVIVM
jgi:hypothetical protein